MHTFWLSNSVTFHLELYFKDIDRSWIKKNIFQWFIMILCKLSIWAPNSPNFHIPINIFKYTIGKTCINSGNHTGFAPFAKKKKNVRFLACLLEREGRWHQTEGRTEGRWMWTRSKYRTPLWKMNTPAGRPQPEFHLSEQENN